MYDVPTYRVHVSLQLTGDVQCLHVWRQPPDPLPGVLLAVLAVEELDIHLS